MKRMVALVAVLAIVAAACGGGGDSGTNLNADDQALADAIATSFLGAAGADAPFGQPEAQCFGDQVVSEMGASRLAGLGLSVTDIKNGASPSDVTLSDADVEAMASAMTECIDFKAMFVNEFKKQGISDEAASCIADGLDDSFVKSMATSALRGSSTDPFANEEAGQAMFALITKCVPLDELQKLGGS